MKKLGINSAAAMGIVNKILPGIMSKIRSKSNDPNDNDFNLEDILGSFGKGGGGIMDSIKNIFKG